MVSAMWAIGASSRSTMQCLKYSYDVAGAPNGPCWLNFVDPGMRWVLDFISRCSCFHQIVERAFFEALVKSGDNASVSCYLTQYSLSHLRRIEISFSMSVYAEVAIKNWKIANLMFFFRSPGDRNNVREKNLGVLTVGSLPCVRQFEDGNFAFFNSVPWKTTVLAILVYRFLGLMF